MEITGKPCNRNTGNGNVDGKPTSTIEETSVLPAVVQESSRTPFVDLTQVDADLALARTLQEQERAYLMLIMPNELRGGNGVEDGDQSIGEDSFDDHALYDYGNDGIGTVEIDPADFPDDEAYARALQYAEEEELAYRFWVMAGLNNNQWQVEDGEDHVFDAQEMNRLPDVDSDEFTYEELLALGDVIGNVRQGLLPTQLSSLPSLTYKSEDKNNGINDSICVICQLDYEDDDALTVLSCKHSYHFECLSTWLQLKKVCPVCSTEVSTSDNP